MTDVFGIVLIRVFVPVLIVAIGPPLLATYKIFPLGAIASSIGDERS